MPYPSTEQVRDDSLTDGVNPDTPRSTLVGGAHSKTSDSVIRRAVAQRARRRVPAQAATTLDDAAATPDVRRSACRRHTR